MDNKLNQILRSDLLLCLIAILIYVTAAINLVGYFHPDEHYQILEFANYKLGKIDASQMPWEFNYEMRSSFQPWIAFWVTKLFNYLHIFNSYSIALALRLITAALSLFAIIRFNNVVLLEIDSKFRIFYKWTSFFLWFIPCLSVRFSSEVWSALLFLLALSYVLPDKKRGYGCLFAGGVFFGLSYLCRFQAAIMITGLILWLLVIGKRSKRKIILIIATTFVVMVFGVYIDYLYYGDWTLSAWNYFNMNIIYDKASNFGSISIYQFFRSAVIGMIFPLGLLVLYCFIVLILKMPRLFVVWCTVPLVVVHLLISHKEVRFLFPIIYFIPFIIVKSINLLVSGTSKANFKNWQKVIIRGVFSTLIAGNIICLVVAIFSPPLNGRLVLAKYIYDNYRNTRIKLFAKKRSNPVNPYSSLTQSFYDIGKVDYSQLNNYDTLPLIATFHDSEKLLVIQRHDFSDSTITSMLYQSQISVLKTGNPPWLFDIKSFFRQNDDEYILCKFN
ncbi:MAG TPA: hypothetical protein VL053_17255 [Arachidicoccus sp.]|nr:hypothetical protein [Arachidicoccus sp.]